MFWWTSVLIILLLISEINCFLTSNEKKLAKAIKQDQVNIVRYLLSQHPGLASSHHRHKYPVQVAAKYSNSLEILKTLIDSGVDVNQQATHNGMTALMYACDRKPFRSDIVLFLLDHGADVNIGENNGMTALMYLLRNKESHQDQLGLVERFVTSGADLKSSSVKDQLYPVHYAAIGSTSEVMRALLSQPTMANSVWSLGPNGETVLMSAIRGKNAQTIDFLVTENPELIDLRDTRGATALHYAAALGQTVTAGYLVDNGADSMIVDNKGLTALYYAVPIKSHDVGFSDQQMAAIRYMALACNGIVRKRTDKDGQEIIDRKTTIFGLELFRQKVSRGFAILPYY